MVMAFLFLHSCKNANFELNVLSEKLEAHRDSVRNSLFIPSKENLRSELTFYHGLLSKAEKISGNGKDSLRVDSVQMILRNQIKKTTGWVTGLENYDLQKIITEQFSKELFLEKKLINQIPLFYRKGKAVLKKEELSDLSIAIEKQTEIYWFLKTELHLSKDEDALLAVKDFIGYLVSIRNEKE